MTRMEKGFVVVMMVVVYQGQHQKSSINCLCFKHFQQGQGEQETEPMANNKQRTTTKNKQSMGYLLELSTTMKPEQQQDKVNKQNKNNKQQGKDDNKKYQYTKLASKEKRVPSAF
jgi:hypothetical protein